MSDENKIVDHDFTTHESPYSKIVEKFVTLDLLVKFSKPSRRVTLFHHLMNRIYKRISKSKEPVIEEKNMNFFYKKIALSKGCFMFLKKKRKKERGCFMSTGP